MASREGKYNIKAISKMLGIQPGTLRAWERRYQIVEPIRNQAGHRLYSDEHVAILRWLIDKVNKGFTIGQAVGLYEKGNVSLQTSDGIELVDHSIQLSDDILTALLLFEENKANLLLNQAFSLFTIEKVTIDILGALLVKVGQMWETEKISTAHEHFVTSFLRTKIGMVFQSLPIDGYLPKVLAVCGPNETHELGLLIYTLFLRRKGFEVIYLGAGIPNEDVELVLREIGAKMFFTSCTMRKNLQKTLQLLDILKEEFPSLLIGAGGFAFDEMSEESKKQYNKYLVGQSKQEWEQWMREHFHQF
ncbi:MerR family transcriptional regulator [Halalkalibacter urbisdiaboli]|uniref:MerR family transcriptional regulator n=1 Tax=Halalkalibacter urbisdiaboli TaxID=1960589 RepID=UPI000B4344DA|nr:MerR family transcriptional regulator [Halalkalibacter urbisdiaboli]